MSREYANEFKPVPSAPPEANTVTPPPSYYDAVVAAHKGVEALPLASVVAEPVVATDPPAVTSPSAYPSYPGAYPVSATGYGQFYPVTGGYGQSYPATGYGQSYPASGYGQSYPATGYGQSYPVSGYPTYPPTAYAPVKPVVAAAKTPVAMVPPKAPPAVRSAEEVAANHSALYPTAALAAMGERLPPAVGSSRHDGALYPSLESKEAEATGFVSATMLFTKHHAMIKVGYTGMVQFIFDNKAAASAFIRENDLRSENPSRKKTAYKQVDDRRYPGQYIVRVGQERYNLLRASLAKTGKPEDLLPTYHAAKALNVDASLRRRDKEMAKLYTAMHAQLAKGGSGMIHFIFKTAASAQSFIDTYALKSENPSASRRGQPKQVDSVRYSHRGQHLVRVGPRLYDDLRVRLAASGKPEDNLPDLTSASRAMRK